MSYTKKKDVLAIINELPRTWDKHFGISKMEYLKIRIKNLPDVDVAPVVRCKDCKHSYEDLCLRVCSYGVSVDCVVPDNFFCADGAKMEVDDG